MTGFLPRARIFLEEAKPPDADALSDIHAEAFAHGWSADDVAALISQENVETLVVRHVPVFGGRRVVGFVIQRTAAGEAEILTLAVTRRARGRGHGRRLMEEALRRLYRDHVTACFLEVDRGNQAAIGLYRSLGFEEVGVRKGYYRDGADPEGAALVMRAQLR